MMDSARPTAADLATMSDAEKRALLARLLGDTAQATHYPLSFAQQRLWFLDRLSPENPAYNIPGVFRLKGPLDRQALEHALNDVVARHQTLRTIFAQIGGEPRQIVKSAAPAALPYRAVSNETEAQVIIDETVAQPFNLARGPLYRAELLSLGTDDHILIIVIHHIASDGWSLGLFNRDLERAYKARIKDDKTGLPPTVRRYVDYAVEQRKALTGDRLDRLLTFWRETLADLPALDLPLDHPRPAVQRFKGAALPLTIPASTLAAAQILAKQEKTTLFPVLLACLAFILRRLARQDDFAIAMPVAGRDQEWVEDQIGFFVNTLALRCRHHEDATFRQAVAHASRTVREAQGHQDLPFEKLVDELNLPRDTSRNPLVQVLFALQNAPMRPLALDGLTISSVPYSLAATRFDLEFHLWDARTTWTGADACAEGLTGSLFYNTDLFTSETAQTIADLVPDCLARLLVSCEVAQSKIGLSNPAAIEHIIACGDGGLAPKAIPLFRQIENQARLTPGRIAQIAADGTSLTYRDMIQRARTMEAGLAAHGIAAGAVVALKLPRGVDFTTALLAASSGGFAILPLEPSQPKTRIDVVLAEAGASLLMIRDEPSLDWPIPTVAPHELLATPANAATFDLHDQDACGPLYIVMTSGSTGRPKAVEMPAAAFANLIDVQRRLHPTAYRVAQMSAVGFDVAMQETLHTLITGGTLVTITDEDRRDPARLVSTLRNHQIERFYAPQALLGMIIVEMARTGETLPALREIITAGEQPIIDDAARIVFARHPNLQLINHYGPAETHVVSEFILDGDPMQWPERPAAGQALEGNRLYVADPTGNLMPLGLPGELWVGGAQVAKGYRGRDTLTAERFGADPFSHHANARLYRTGDLARLHANGQLVLLGRIDEQIKIRGFRVEPAEVEALLRLLPGIDDCCVTTEGTPEGRLDLVATIVAKTMIVPQTLRDWLRPQLPDFMVPNRYAATDIIPLSPNGKIDRIALAQKRRWLHDDVTRIVQPRTREERIIADLWCNLLGLDEIDCHATFFDLGGNSLLIITAHSKLVALFGTSLTVSDLFHYPTVAALAQHVAAPQAASTDQSMLARRAARQRAQMKAS